MGARYTPLPKGLRARHDGVLYDAVYLTESEGRIDVVGSAEKVIKKQCLASAGRGVGFDLDLICLEQ